MIHGGCFRETKENIIRLPEDDVTSFSVFAQYLYAGSQCDTRCSLDIKNMNMDSENWLSVIQPDIFHSTFGNPCILSSEEDWIDDELSDLEVKDNAAHDAYNFMLQFSCYVLADKIQASGFKQLIMNEVWRYGDICNPADLTVKHVRYVYQNTISRYDPLRQFCIMIRGGSIPIEETFADDEFVALMEEGGALVADMMWECRHQALMQKQKVESYERENADCKREVQHYREQNQICIDKNQTYERDIRALKERLQQLEHSRSPMFCTTTDSSPMFQNPGAFRHWWLESMLS